MYKKNIALFVLLLICTSSKPMESNQPDSTSITSATAEWVGSWIPLYRQLKNSLENGVKLTPEVKITSETNDAIIIASGNFKSAIDNAANVIDEVGKNGIKISDETVNTLNKTGINLMKTYLVAGIGASLALSGIILFIHTLIKESDKKDDDQKNLLQQIISNRYLISSALFVSGLALILKSNDVVKTLS